MQHPQLPAPPRYGNWNANVELLAGAKFPAVNNPYLPAIKQLMEKKNNKPLGEWHMGHIALFGALLVREGVVGKDKEFLKELMYKALTKGKPHNNGEDTCNECEVIKKGV